MKSASWKPWVLSQRYHTHPFRWNYHCSEMIVVVAIIMWNWLGSNTEKFCSFWDSCIGKIQSDQKRQSVQDIKTMLSLRRQVQKLLCLSHPCSVMSDSFATLWAVAHQALLSMEFSLQEYWSIPPPESLPDPGIKSASPALQLNSLTLRHLGSPSCVWGSKHLVMIKISISPQVKFE